MISDQDKFIERRVVTGMIVNTDYLRGVSSIWNPRLLNSPTAKMVAGWCLEYFTKYNKAPNRDIEGIYTQKLKEGMEKEKAEDVEDILGGLSEEYERDQFNVEYLRDQTLNYFKEQHLKILADDIKSELTSGSITEAEKLATGYSPIQKESSQVIDPFASAERIKKAFEEKSKPLMRFGKSLGRMWDQQFTRDAFVALMGPEKRGKTFWLMEIGFRGLYNGCNVAFFQAGDMSETQMLRRLAIYLAQRSDQERYCGGIYIPVPDCIRNQTDQCRNAEREGCFGIFLDEGDAKDATYEMLVASSLKFPDYKPCQGDCKSRIGTVWFKYRPPTDPLDWKDAVRVMAKFQGQIKKRMKLVTYPNEALCISEINAYLDTWERSENYVPDVVIIDYADILASDPDCKNLDHRNQQNRIWQRLRKLSQVRHCLVVTATQSDAASYDQDLIQMKNFSEDKRKYGHVTAMYGLNQGSEEKKIGIMRINEVVVREGDFDRTNFVRVLQRLQIGRPYLGSL